MDIGDLKREVNKPGPGLRIRVSNMQTIGQETSGNGLDCHNKKCNNLALRAEPGRQTHKMQKLLDRNCCGGQGSDWEKYIEVSEHITACFI